MLVLHGCPQVSCTWLSWPLVVTLPLHRRDIDRPHSRDTVGRICMQASAHPQPQDASRERMWGLPFLGSPSKGGGKPWSPLHPVAGPSDPSTPFMYLGSDGSAGPLATGQWVSR